MHQFYLDHFVLFKRKRELCGESEKIIEEFLPIHVCSNKFFLKIFIYIFVILKHETLISLRIVSCYSVKVKLTLYFGEYYIFFFCWRMNMSRAVPREIQQKPRAVECLNVISYSVFSVFSGDDESKIAFYAIEIL